LIFYRLLNKRNLFDKSSFEREKCLINESMIPTSSRAINNDITYSGSIRLPIVGGKNFVAILPYNPVVLPNLDGLTIFYFPATAIFYSVNSLIDTLSCITCRSAISSMENIRVRIVFCF
jgi:hypothetical protein